MKLLSAFSLLLLWALNIHAQGLIWSVNNWADNTIAAPGGSYPGGNWQIAFDNVSADVGYPPSVNPVSGIFSMSLGTNDAGRTFSANAGNEPGFARFVAGLTDGANGYLRFQDGAPNSWQPWREQDFLGRCAAAAPDLAGYNITEIHLRVNNFYDYFDVPEDRYFRRLEYSLDFYGVPEPSTWALLALGAAALLMRRKSRKQHPAPRA